MLEIVDRTFSVDPSDLLPAVTPSNATFWDGLEKGLVLAQCCNVCDRFRFPNAPVCPHCGATPARWEALSETGEVFSWVRYHKSFLPEFADIMPYVVACVEFPEGVRMLGRLLDVAIDVPVKIRSSVRTKIERWPDGRCVVCFVAQD
jgi:uncharacterized OB-fold protein